MRHFIIAILCLVGVSAVSEARTITTIHERSEQIDKSHLRIQDQIFSLVYDHGVDYDSQRIQKLRERAEELLEEKENLWADALAMKSK